MTSPAVPVQLDSPRGIVVGGLYRSSAGNLWWVSELRGDRIHVHLYRPGRADHGSGFWWHWTSLECSGETFAGLHPAYVPPDFEPPPEPIG